jgi:hypothetical protein
LRRNNETPPNQRHSTRYEDTRPKNIKNALAYTELTEFKDDEYACKVAKTVEEASQLIESGCEHFCGYNGESSEVANKP